MKFYFFLFGGVFFSVLFFPNVSVAADGLSVEPAFQEVTLEASQSQAEFSITLHNNTSQPIVLRPSVVDFGTLDETGGVAFLGKADDLERKYALASWMRPQKDMVSLGAGESEVLLVTIENRESLSPGGHYGAVLFQMSNNEAFSDTGNAIAVKQILSVLVFAKKQGGEVYQLALKDWEWRQNVFFVPPQIHLRFQNQGNVHVVPRGRVIISDPLGRVVRKGILNEESTLILPETMRRYLVTFVPLLRSFIPGRYTVEIAYRYDGEENFTVTSFQFDFIPPLAILSFLILVTGGWYVRKRRSITGEKKAVDRSFSAKSKDV